MCACKPLFRGKKGLCYLCAKAPRVVSTGQELVTRRWNMRDQQHAIDGGEGKRTSVGDAGEWG